MIRKIFIPTLVLVSLFMIQCDNKKKNYIPIQTIANQSAPTTTSNTSVTQPTTATSTGTGTGSTTSTTTTSVSSTQAVIGADYGTETFSYQTTRPISIDATVVDGDDKPITGALVEIRDSEDKNSVYQQLSNALGKVVGSLTLNTTETKIYVYVTYNGVTTAATIVAIKQDNKVLIKITTIKIPIKTADLQVATSASTSGTNSVSLTDTDGDGVLDQYDDYPNDATKATKLRFPSSGVNTIGFEGTFPSAGDADLNDLVTIYYIEEDQNAAGQIVEIRGSFQNMAHGAGNQYSLNLRLPSTVNVTYESEVRDGNSVLQATAVATKSTTEVTGVSQYTPSATDLQDGLRILGNTLTTVGSTWYTKNTDTTYAAGYMAKIKVKFNTPVDRSVIGTAPYDTFVRVETKPIATTPGYPSEGPKSVTTASSFQVYEIHLPGKYKYTTTATVDSVVRNAGEDIYIDKNGFPFAVLVPGLWKWPAESKDLRVAASSGYPRFATWVSSAGQTDMDWYDDASAATSANVYYSFVTTNRAALDTPSSQLLAFIGGVSLAQYQGLLVLILVLISMILFYRRSHSPKQI